MKRLPATLRSLHMTITVVMPNDDNGHDLAVSEQAVTPFLRLQTIHEYKHIEPGQLSRPHLVAFLTDPLNMLRKLKLEKGGEGFELSFDGCKGTVPAWSEIPRRVRDAVCGGSEMRDYELFSRHYAELRPLLEALEVLNRLFLQARRVGTQASKGKDETNSQLLTPPRATPEEPIDLTGDDVTDLTGDAEETPSEATAIVKAVLEKLACARIRGRVKAAQKHTVTLLGRSKRLALRTMDWAKMQGRADVQSAAEKLYDIWCSMEGTPLEPADVSFYGYNEMDVRLAEWKMDRVGFVHYQHAAAGQKPVKSKRKRGADDDEEFDEEEAIRNKIPLWPGGPLRAHKRVKPTE